jgi:hypothetical protein
MLSPLRFASPARQYLDTLYFLADRLIEDDVAQIDKAIPTTMRVGVPVGVAVYVTLVLIHVDSPSSWIGLRGVPAPPGPFTLCRGSLPGVSGCV